MTHDAADVAAWMLGELDRALWLYQETVVYQIKEKFGDDFVYINQNGNLAIRKDILTSFRKLTGDEVIWERGSRAWRRRQAHDGKGRQQD